VLAAIVDVLGAAYPMGCITKSRYNKNLIHKKRPSLKSPEAWRQYWQAKGFPWRTEPGMDRERRKELAQQRAIRAGIKQGISLQRGEVEWYRRSMIPVGKGLRSEIY